jgi:UDP-glucose 4-epimerase
LLKAVLQDRPAVIYGDGSVVRDYVYAGDIAEAAVLCLEDESAAAGSVETFNIGTGQGTSLLDIIRMVEETVGRTLENERRPAREFDCPYSVLDSSAIRSRLGWQPSVDLREGITRTWSWLRQQQG